MIQRTLVIMLSACLLLVSSSGIAEITKESTNTTLTADEILDRMAETYATCKTYQDSGVVRTKFIQENGERIVEKFFTTAFIRPDQFRFEYREKKNYAIEEERSIIWAKGNEVLKWWDVKPGIQKVESLSMAIAGATGGSSGAAHTIPALLLPCEIGGRLLTDIREAKRLADETLDNVNYFRIAGKYAGDPTIIWIDAKSFLVRLITTQHTFPDFHLEEATLYNPSLDGLISDETLEFNPPKSK